MFMSIDNGILIKDIQYQFNKAYPYLWIHFYYSAITQAVPDNAEPVDPELPVRNLVRLEAPTAVDIRGSVTVASLEKEFSDVLNMTVKVYRKLGTVWVGTPYTNGWSLENQNFEAQQITLG